MGLQLSSRAAVWQVTPMNWEELPEGDRRACASLFDDYGATLATAGGGRFRRYRTAEICARSLRNTLGVQPEIHLEVSESAELMPS